MFNLNGVIFTRLEVAHHLYCGCVTAPPWEYVKPGDELSSMHIVQWQWKTFHLNGVRICSTGTSLFSTAWLWRNRCLFISGELPPPLGGSGPPPNTWFFGPTRVHNPNGTSIRSFVSLQRTVFSPYTLQWGHWGGTCPPKLGVIGTLEFFLHFSAIWSIFAA